VEQSTLGTLPRDESRYVGIWLFDWYFKGTGKILYARTAALAEAVDSGDFSKICKR
jgi:hypothetical protein